MVEAVRGEEAFLRLVSFLSFADEDFEGLAGSVGVEEELGGGVFGVGVGVLEDEVLLSLKGGGFPAELL